MTTPLRRRYAPDADEIRWERCVKIVSPDCRLCMHAKVKLNTALNMRRADPFDWRFIKDTQRIGPVTCAKDQWDGLRRGYKSVATFMVGPRLAAVKCRYYDPDDQPENSLESGNPVEDQAT